MPRRPKPAAELEWGVSDTVTHSNNSFTIWCQLSENHDVILLLITFPTVILLCHPAASYAACCQPAHILMLCMPNFATGSSQTFSICFSTSSRISRCEMCQNCKLRNTRDPGVKTATYVWFSCDTITVMIAATCREVYNHWNTLTHQQLCLHFPFGQVCIWDKYALLKTQFKLIGL